MSDFEPTKEQLQILEQLKEATEPYYVYSDQMMAIAILVDAEFKQKSKANEGNKQQDKALHLRGVVFSETECKYKDSCGHDLCNLTECDEFEEKVSEAEVCHCDDNVGEYVEIKVCTKCRKPLSKEWQT